MTEQLTYPDEKFTFFSNFKKCWNVISFQFDDKIMEFDKMKPTQNAQNKRTSVRLGGQGFSPKSKSSALI